MKICILGAGISGVTLARLLAADGHQVVCLEKADRPGGLCRSRVTDGFTWDEAGGHILFSKNKEVLAWQQARARAVTDLCEIQRQTRILWHDRFVPYPFENGVGHLTKEAIVDCMTGYVEAYVRRQRGEPTPANFKDWIGWRMGDGFARHFMVPYNEKIWDCDLSTMTSSWVAGRVPEAPLRDVISSAVGVDTDGYTHQSVFWFPREGGFEAMVHGTVQGGGFTLRTGTAAERVTKVGSRFAVDGEDFDLVVNTVPLPLIEPHIAEIPEAIRADIRALQPISLVNVIIGVKVDAPIAPLSWIYLPFAHQGFANRVTYFSNYSPDNAPPGHASFMAEVTHRGDITPDQAFVDELVANLARCGLFDRSQVVMTDWMDHRFAYIDQNLEFPARVARVREWFDTSGYITFGRFGRYDYHNSDQCIARAMEIHQHVRTIAASGAPARPVFA